ncbi:homoserine dehydrogenase [Camelliibacillus cellulosilyticus]|uniref:Homoserine dehydrogenase n=1 Tax=Camelliibacillus cellulosilyticus TaxID=2174486 RepID=A0ABV9GM82_9BACL
MAIKAALLGFGTVGSAVYRLLDERANEIEQLIGEKINVTHVVIKNQEKTRAIKDDTIITTDFFNVLETADIDVVIEAIVGIEPALTYLCHSLKKGIPVVTANKALFSQKADVLKSAADGRAPIGFEATVAGGVPIIRTLTDLLTVNRVSKVEGILNGTANFILTDMRVNGRAFNDSLKLAQEKGYAEANPESDILGIDAFYKLMILCDTVFGEQPDWEKVGRQGIDQVQLSDLREAEKAGKRLKLIAHAERAACGEIQAQVIPTFVTSSHPLYGVEGVDNAITVHTDLLGELTLKGPGAGGNPTGSAMIEDLVRLFAGQRIDRTGDNTKPEHPVLVGGRGR